MTMRHAMSPFRAHVLPGPEVLIATPEREFDADWRLTNDRAQALLAELMDDLRAAAVRRVAG